MNESRYGNRDDRNHYRPFKRVDYPPLFVWPLQPIKGLRWIFSIPGYFFPWNMIYVIIGVSAWYLLSPPLENFSKITFENISLLFMRNSSFVAIYFGAFHVRLYIQKKQGTAFKFNPNWPNTTSKKFILGNQNLDNIIWTFGSGVVIWTLLEVGILWLAANNILNVISPTDRPYYFIFMILTVHLWRDIHFYLIHRVIHWGPLYRHAHYIHHKNNNPGPWSGLAMHPTEHIFYFSCVLFYLIFPFHPAFAVVTLVHAGLSPAPGHAGFERMILKNANFDIDAYAHYLHHKHFECNYADGILPLDRWFGTFHDGSLEAQEKMKKRLKEQAVNKKTNIA